jgi:hypothetical protein
VVIGDVKKIDLGTSSFERIITGGCLYVDKSRFVEDFLGEAPSVQLIARQRRLGKSLNLDMLRCFLTDAEDHRPLFKGLYIEQSGVWGMAHTAPAFLFDFKSLDREKYREQVQSKINESLYRYTCDPACPEPLRQTYAQWISGATSDTDGFRLLTEVAHAVSGKRPYLLIDEYDKLLFDVAGTDAYESVRRYMTTLFSAGMKGNIHLEKALLTGVTRISHEGLLSDLNNITTYDVFRDSVYPEDYGLTEEETGELSELAGFDLDEARAWYNGIRAGGHAIYNTYGVMSMIKNREFDCYWGKSGMMDKIVSLLTPERKRTVLNMLEPGRTETVDIENKLGPEKLFGENRDEMFYSLLVQSGYLALEELRGLTGRVSIPNTELRDVWKRFLLERVLPSSRPIGQLLESTEEPERFAEDFAAFLRPLLEGLSYFDLPARTDRRDGKRRTPESHYHLFVYGVLRMCEDRMGYRRLLSNRESGDGRYDILMEFTDKAIVFELKSAADDEDLPATARQALRQALDARYGADLGKPVCAVGLAFRGKDCEGASAALRAAE